MCEIATQQLAARCRNTRPDGSHEPFCLELFHRAVVDGCSLCRYYLHNYPGQTARAASLAMSCHISNRAPYPLSLRHTARSGGWSPKWNGMNALWTREIGRIKRNLLDWLRRQLTLRDMCENAEIGRLIK